MAKSQVSPAPAGWYRDPQDLGLVRYWDGAVWTDDRKPRIRTGTVGGNRIDEWRTAGDALNLVVRSRRLLPSPWSLVMEGQVGGFKVHVHLTETTAREGQGKAFGARFRVDLGAAWPDGMTIRRRHRTQRVRGGSGIGRRVLTDDPEFDSKVVVRGDATYGLAHLTDQRRAALLHATSEDIAVADGALVVTRWGDLNASELVQTVSYLLTLAQLLTSE